MSTITDQIKERVAIVDLIREYVPELKKAGTNWKARCPFHQEKTPSFTVSDDKQMWHCFGCSKGGDIFGFLQEIEGIDFAESLRTLAKRAGVKLERQDPKEESERSRLLDILRLASAWYHQALKVAKSGEHARTYVAGRGITDETRDSWQLGFAPDAWDELLKYLTSRGYREQEIARAGLAAPNNRGGHYDRFRNRLLFPLSDVHGNVIGFAGRKLKEEDIGGKYINTPETAVYHKSSMLYGLSRAKQAIRTEGRAVVVEGNMDCLSSHQTGIANVVASSGTALTPEQVRLLKRYTKEVALAFDPDSAGQDALVRGLEVAWREDMVIKVITLPKGEDPDALIRRSPAEWRERIAKAADFMDWLFDAYERRHDLATASGKKEFAKHLLNWIRRIPDAIVQTHYLQRLSRSVRVDEQILRGLVVKRQSEPRRSRPGTPSSGVVLASPERSVLERSSIRLVALAFASGTAGEALKDFSVEWLPTARLVNLYKTLEFFYDTDVQKSRESWLASLPMELAPLGREAALLADELSQGADAEAMGRDMANITRRLRTHYLKEKLAVLREKIQSAESRGALDELQTHIALWQELSREIRNV